MLQLMKLDTMHNIVKKVLEEDKKTRVSDKLLFVRVCETLGINTSRARLIELYTNQDIPSWETVSRCRRKVQELHPELKDENATVSRQEKIEYYVAYATNKHLD